MLAVIPPAGPRQAMTFPIWQVRCPQTAVDRVVAKGPFATVTPESYGRATRKMADVLRCYGLFASRIIIAR